MQRRLALVILLAASPLFAQAQQPASGPGTPDEELANAPQARGAKGDQQRHYFFAEARAEMPYRLYVPQSYDPAKKTPLVVALHGYGGNQDYFFAARSDHRDLL